MSLLTEPAAAQPHRGSRSVPTELSTTHLSGKILPLGLNPIVKVRRRTIDAVLIGAGAAATLVLVVAGSLLTWGNRFAHRLRRPGARPSPPIVFPDEAALVEQGRTDLVGFAGQQLNTGSEAEAYASYIDGHLAETADGATYSELGCSHPPANAAVQAAKDSGASAAEITALQEEATTITGQRNTLFKGETLRGLLLSTFAWSTVGRIAGIAAVAAFVAAGLMLVLVVLGVVHHRRTPKT